MRQRVREIVSVLDQQSFRVQGRSGGVELELEAVWMKGHRPEQPARGNRGRVVVNLLKRVRRSNWTGEEVQSYEPEDTLMEVAVFGDEDALHEPHVRLIREGAGILRTRARAPQPRQADEPLEIGDL